MAAKVLHLSLLLLLCSSLFLFFSDVVESDDVGGDRGGGFRPDTGSDVGGDVGGDSDVGEGKFSEKSSGGIGAGTGSSPPVSNGGYMMTPMPDLHLSCALLIIFLAAMYVDVIAV